MKNNLLVLALLSFFVMGCNDQNSAHQETVTKYFSARDAGNFKELKNTINDSITAISGDFSTKYSHDSFYEQFKWDSVFNPTYKIVELEEVNNEIIVAVAQSNVRNEFLEKNPLVFRVKVSFNSGKISKLEELADSDEDWKVWAEKRDSLVSWVKKNHPKFDGFVNDMTMNGARDYVKVIKLYKKSQLKE